MVNVVDGENDEVDEDGLLELGQFLGKETDADMKLNEDLTPTQREVVQKLLHEYQDMFSNYQELLI